MIKKSTTNKFKTKVALISKAIEQETEEILRDAEVAAKMSLPFNVSGKSLVKIESKLMNEGIGAKFDTKMPRFASKEDEPETVEIEQEQIDTICECITNAVVEELEDVLDRKSTRLNSSHANISYAVFCLKKKTQQK